MPDTSADVPDITGSSSDPQFFYTVLNLPTTASDQEIRERYRQLSIIFHPDKQHVDETKETATKRFLEVQKAYQVLSDPVTRRAYDLLGPEGLKEVDTASFVGLSSDELDRGLVRQGFKAKQEHLEDAVRSKGRLSVEVDASSLFSESDPYAADEPWYVQARERVREVHRTGFALRHSFQKQVNDKTLLTFSSRGGGNARGGFMGTIRHQYSPHWDFETTTSLLNPTLPTVKALWHDDSSTVMLQTHLSLFYTRLVAPRAGRRLLPPLTLALTRRLFPDAATEGQLVLTNTNGTPAVNLSIASTHLFDPADATSHRGLAPAAVFWSAGLVLAGRASGPAAELGLHLRALGVRVRAALEANLAAGVGWLVGAEWRGEQSLLGAHVALGAEGVSLRFEAMYLGQQLSVPIVLAHEREPALALWTTLVPSAALVAAYYFLLLPRRRRQRAQFFRRLRQELRDGAADARESKETARLLQDSARRHTQAEAARHGLVIEEATYGPAERDAATEGLDVDVTVALQALVARSQLYIPGRRSKAGLQGFCDPAAQVAKALRVRYTFRGRAHYAEVPDRVPVVLPLEEHLVE